MSQGAPDQYELATPEEKQKAAQVADTFYHDNAAWRKFVADCGGVDEAHRAAEAIRKVANNPNAFGFTSAFNSIAPAARTATFQLLGIREENEGEL
jgi:hypothetical protein